MRAEKILIAGGYGVVGRRLAAHLEANRAGRVVLAGRHPDPTVSLPGRTIDVNDRASVESSLDGVTLVVACVRQREPHLLRAAVRRGIAYTSIAPPWIAWAETAPLRAEAERTGARIVLAAGLEPGITSVLARVAADRLGGVDTIETALLLSLGDAYGPDSMAFIFEEVTEPYSVTIDGKRVVAHAFGRSRAVDFPAPVGRRRAYTMPFRDQLSYPETLGARTAIARIALDPPWLARVVSVLLPIGLRALMRRRRGARGRVERLIATLRARYTDRDRYAAVVESRRGDRIIRSTLIGRDQAEATAVAVGAVAEALWRGEVSTPGVWLPEQVIAPEPFLARLAAQGIVPRIEEMPRPRGRYADEQLLDAAAAAPRAVGPARPK